MIEHRPFSSLYVSENTWLRARPHFAFAGRGRPEHLPLGPLMVWNDDEFAPYSGFPPHLHQSVEIVTYVWEGAITHQDDLGNKRRIANGEVQVMSAGSGIIHSEFNAESMPTHLFQI